MAKKEKSSLKMTPPVSETRAEAERPVSRDEFLKGAAKRKSASGDEAPAEAREKPAARAARPASEAAPVHDAFSGFPLMEIFFPPLLWSRLEASMSRWYEAFGGFYRMDAFFPPFPPFSVGPSRNSGVAVPRRDPDTNGRNQENRTGPEAGRVDETDLAVIAEALTLLIDESSDMEQIEKKRSAGQFLSNRERRQLETAEKLKGLREKLERLSRSSRPG